jgi:SRSO17 transposase
MWGFSDIKRKTLPAISRVLGLSNEQQLLHFLSELLKNSKA